VTDPHQHGAVITVCTATAAAALDKRTGKTVKKRREDDDVIPVANGSIQSAMVVKC
jgi:hypothetical protein